jgi:hypothetical protein
MRVNLGSHRANFMRESGAYAQNRAAGYVEYVVMIGVPSVPSRSTAKPNRDGASPG